MTTFIARSTPLLTLVLVLAASPAVADEVTDKAKAGLEELRFDDALSIATDGLEEGTRGPDELVTLYMILGQVSASMGEEKKAESYFQAALSIDKATHLPEGVSPKLSEPFATAKSIIGDAEPISLLSEVDESRQLSVQITSDPAKLAAGAIVKFTAAGNEETLTADGSGTLRIEIPEGATDLQVALVDEFGNRLCPLIDVAAVSGPTEQVTIVGQDKKAGPPIYRRWQVYAGLAVGTLATGAYFGNESRNKTDEIASLEDGTEFSVAQALEDKARSSALIANIGFAATLGFGAAAVWLYMSESSDQEPEQGAAIFPIVGADRAGLAASVRF